MEEYIREAPTMVSVPLRRLVEDKESLLIECATEPETEPKPKFKPKKDKIVPSFISQTYDNDLLGLNQIDPKAVEVDQNNAMALGIIQSGNYPQSSFTDRNGSKTTPGWELALVEKNIDIENKSQSKLGGQFDKFLLDSLFQDDVAKRHIQLQNAGYNTSYKCNMQYNPFDQQLPLQDPFMMSSRIAPPMNVQMTMLHQQQYQNQYPHLYQQPYKQQNMLVVYNNQHTMGTSNPFGDVYESPQSSKASHGNQGLV